MGMRTPLRTGANPSLVVDVAAMTAENDRYRRPDAADEALWTLDAAVATVAAVRAAAPGPPPIPTVRPRDGNYLGAECGSQAQYTSAFDKAFPGVSEVLRRVNNVYVAGGAANWPLVHDVDDNCAPDDVDFFIVGIDPADTRGLWNTVDKIRSELMTMAPGDHWRKEMTPGVLTMWCSGPGEPDRKYQVILRAFATVSALLHGFDLASAGIAFDGETAYMTHAAVWAHTFMLNVVNPAYRSTTYEFRLEKYFDRGYGLGLPGLDPDAISEDAGVLHLPRITIGVVSVRDRIHLVGNVERVGRTEGIGSDYAPDDNRTQIDLYNIRQVMLGCARYRYKLDSDEALGEFIEAVPPPSLDDVLPRGVLGAALDDCDYSAVNLRSIFQMRDMDIYRFQQSVASAAAAAPPTECAAVERAAARIAIAPFRAALFAAHRAAPRKISWWILTDPSRQYTVSLNPRMEDDKAWYGAAAVRRPQ